MINYLRDDNMKCPNCEKTYSDEFYFCPYCGHEKNEDKFCPKCNMTYGKNSEYCITCGTKLLNKNSKQRQTINLSKPKTKSELLKYLDGCNITNSIRISLKNEIRQNKITDMKTLVNRINEEKISFNKKYPTQKDLSKNPRYYGKNKQKQNPPQYFKERKQNQNKINKNSRVQPQKSYATVDISSLKRLFYVKKYVGEKHIYSFYCYAVHVKKRLGFAIVFKDKNENFIWDPEGMVEAENNPEIRKDLVKLGTFFRESRIEMVKKKKKKINRELNFGGLPVTETIYLKKPSLSLSGRPWVSRFSYDVLDETRWVVIPEYPKISNN